MFDIHSYLSQDVINLICFISIFVLFLTVAFIIKGFYYLIVYKYAKMIARDVYKDVTRK